MIFDTRVTIKTSILTKLDIANLVNNVERTFRNEPFAKIMS